LVKVRLTSVVDGLKGLSGNDFLMNYMRLNEGLLPDKRKISLPSYAAFERVN